MVVYREGGEGLLKSGINTKSKDGGEGFCNASDDDKHIIFKKKFNG